MLRLVGDDLAAITYLADVRYYFGASLNGTDGGASGEILANHDGYRTAPGIVLNGMTGGSRPFTDEQVVCPVVTVHAIQQALIQDGGPVPVAPLITHALGD